MLDTAQRAAQFTEQQEISLQQASMLYCFYLGSPHNALHLTSTVHEVLVTPKPPMRTYVLLFCNEFYCFFIL